MISAFTTGQCSGKELNCKPDAQVPMTFCLFLSLAGKSRSAKESRDWKESVVQWFLQC